MVKGIGIKPDARFFIIHNLTSMVKKGTVLLFLRGGQVSYVVPHPRKKVNTRHLDGVSVLWFGFALLMLCHLPRV